MSARRCGLGLALLALGLAAGVRDLAAQAAGERFGDCDFRSFRLLTSSSDIAGYRVTWVSLPDVVCSDGVHIRADSAVSYESLGRTEFIGGFRYEDAERALSSVDADYLEQQGQLFARGAVELHTLDDETLVRGDELTMYEMGEGPEDDRLVVTGGPAFARMTPSVPDSANGAEPSTPFEVTAPRMSFEGQDLFSADGSVVVDQDSLHATTSSLSYDRASGNLRMNGNAHLESGDATFDSESMSLYLPGGELSSITLDRSGRLVSDDIELTAEHIQAEVSDDKIQHLAAAHRDAAGSQATQPAQAAQADVTEPSATAPEGTTEVEGPERPQAIAPDFVLTGDSLDVAAPDGVLQMVRAVGGARGVSLPPPSGGDEPAASEPKPPEIAVGKTADDSVSVGSSILANDWIEGDTIEATFKPAPEGEPIDEGASAEGQDYVLDRLVAIGNARSLYRSPPRQEEGDGGEEAPLPDRSEWAISYVLGDRISLTLVDGTVESAEVENAIGLYQEPVEPPPARADSVSADASADPEVRP